MASELPLSSCCLESFNWGGSPVGQETTLSTNKSYVTGNNPDAAVLYIHDALGWKFENARLLADHFAQEADVTVYVPDFFGGEELDKQKIMDGKWHELDLVGFRKRNDRDVREPEIMACARALREKGFKKIGAVGYCFGGWGALCLASAKPPDGAALVDAAVVAHPSWVTKEDFDHIAVPLQFLAPEKDHSFSPEMKLHAFQKLAIEQRSVPFEWVHFPGVMHGCLTKGDKNTPGEREAMIKGKNAAVSWFKQYLVL